ncbi:hypothetical protein OPV22_033989 [Ensete ventricosum]|uniref:Uncharacterized protein n=1 Tax=Ensete ventricosum TaxID=4639 RepID=A0AAV8PVS0_ENSVE|nr:hypothetical protein OPV22_033989 [Ensete ventricosum]
MAATPTLSLVYGTPACTDAITNRLSNGSGGLAIVRVIHGCCREKPEMQLGQNAIRERFMHGGAVDAFPPMDAVPLWTDCQCTA